MGRDEVVGVMVLEGREVKYGRLFELKSTFEAPTIHQAIEQSRRRTA